LKQVPDKLVVIGAGVIGVELVSCVFHIISVEFHYRHFTAVIGQLLSH